MKTGPETPWPGPWEAIGLVLALFLCEWVAYAVLHDANGWLGLQSSETAALATVLGNGAVFAVVMQRRGLGWRALLHDTPASPVATLGVLAAPILMLLPALVVGNLVIVGALTAVFPLSAAEQAMFERMAEPTVPAMLGACVLAPLLEEMLFRGIVLRGFLARYPRRHAIALSALLFGFAHLNLYQFVAASLLGLGLGWLYERTRSLLPGILLHASYNTALLSLTHGLGEGTSMAAWAWLTVGGLALSALGVRLLRRWLLPARG